MKKKPNKPNVFAIMRYQKKKKKKNSDFIII